MLGLWAEMSDAFYHKNLAEGGTENEDAFHRLLDL